MPPKSLITQQKVSPAKEARAVELRQRMTPAEKRLWDRLRGSRLGGFHFRRQLVIGHYIVDFYCHRAELVIEVDGEIHQYQQKQDQERQEWLQSLGLRVIRFSNQEVMQNLDGVLTEILRVCMIPTPNPSLKGGEPTLQGGEPEDDEFTEDANEYDPA